ncbi:MAG: serine/threonine protein kinase [Pyrinomonadaceae bacterium]
MIDELEGKIIAEKYRIESILRDSDLGTFYRGWNVLVDRPVTIKILAPALAVDQRFIERFLSEAKNLSQASHSNILNVTDFGTDARGICYTVYESAEGVTLENLLTQNETLPVTQALHIAKQAAAGIAATHATGLTHGSLSPAKILVAKDDETVKVFDFGAEPVGKNSTADIKYLSPEQYADVTKTDARSDIYSLGVILYEMLAGSVPFTGKNTAELKQKQDFEPPAPLLASRSDLPADLEPMILSAIAADPEKRYQTMAAFAEDFNLVSGEAPSPNKTKAAAAPRKNIWQTAFIVLAGMTILAGALIYATSNKKTDPTNNLQADVGYLPVQPIGPATGAQEESLAKLPPMTEAEIMAAESSNTALPLDMMPGGDGYNPWASGVAPPPGAPPGQYLQPGGQYYTIDPNNPSQFMPPDGGVILVPVPANMDTAIKPSPTPKTAPANAAPQTSPPATTPKTFATPPPKDKPSAATPNKEKTPKSGKQTDS